MKKEKTYCVYCKEQIGDGALICPHCNSYCPRTNWSKLIFLIIGLLIKLVIPLIVIGFTIYQLKLAKNEKTKATEARQLADSALIEVNNHIDEIKRFQARQFRIKDEAKFKFFFSGSDWYYLPLSSALTKRGSIHGNIYNNLVFFNNAARQRIKLNEKNVQKYYFDLFEIVFINWYSNEFSKKWNDFNIENPTIIKSDIIKSQLSINKCIKTLDSKIDTWYLPQGCMMKIIHDSPIDTMPFQIPIEMHSTTIIIENQDFKFRIKFSNSLGYGKVKNHHFKESIVFDYIKNKDILAQNIKIEFLANFKYENSLTKKTQLEYNWITEFIRKFKNDFDWELVRSDL